MTGYQSDWLTKDYRLKDGTLASITFDHVNPNFAFWLTLAENFLMKCHVFHLSPLQILILNHMPNSIIHEAKAILVIINVIEMY